MITLKVMRMEVRILGMAFLMTPTPASTPNEFADYLDRIPQTQISLLVGFGTRSASHRSIITVDMV